MPVRTHYKPVLILMLLGLLSACSDFSPEAELARLSDKYGITIKAGDPAHFFVPPYTEADAEIHRAVMTPAKGEALEEALKGADEALSAYPTGYFSKLSKAVFFAGTLKFDDVEAGGSYGPEWIVIVADIDDPSAAIYETARYGVHHEFSSLVWKRSPETQLAWSLLMPEGWQPAQSSAKALEITEKEHPTYNNGFLSEYAKTSAENDFNTYAEIAFLEPERLAALAKEQPIIAEKLGILIRAYQEVSSDINSTFSKLGLLEFADVYGDPIALPIKLILPPRNMSSKE
ncbi:hypothetical protein M3P05_17875 [Sansalvadorimonas sp. 2012CJ34-2]|uniref:Lipoprotein n=1 Tax=Parendozoicomonas callyspongiae TaxID=2942213 RepID=A0ABT0PKJ0_9GAMM|nr:hypothetical protein [Sansalvadorimonas sp. 2012CJ34-2]MCL6271791.1 hypothetical protein [Sansalvadorimonas sp. 2012CJ34-2]